MILAGIDCKKCSHLDKADRAEKVRCTARNKEYYIGQRIPCEEKEVMKNGSKG